MIGKGTEMKKICYRVMMNGRFGYFRICTPRKTFAGVVRECRKVYGNRVDIQVDLTDLSAEEGHRLNGKSLSPDVDTTVPPYVKG